jgi:hypothetical protein
MADNISLLVVGCSFHSAMQLRGCRFSVLTIGATSAGPLVASSSIFPNSHGTSGLPVLLAALLAATFFIMVLCLLRCLVDLLCWVPALHHAWLEDVQRDFWQLGGRTET